MPAIRHRHESCTEEELNVILEDFKSWDLVSVIWDGKKFHLFFTMPYDGKG